MNCDSTIPGIRNVLVPDQTFRKSSSAIICDSPESTASVCPYVFSSAIHSESFPLPELYVSFLLWAQYELNIVSHLATIEFEAPECYDLTHAVACPDRAYQYTPRDGGVQQILITE